MDEKKKNNPAHYQLATFLLTCKRCFDSIALFITFLVITSLAYVAQLNAQEVIDPRTGRLFLEVTDLAVPAGPISLPVKRAFRHWEAPSSLLGSKWQLNWESRLFHSGQEVVILDWNGPMVFQREDESGDFKSFFGESLIFYEDGTAVCIHRDGHRAVYDMMGRLIKKKNPNGNTVALMYDTDGHLNRIEGPRGSYLEVTTDDRGRIILVEASTGTKVKYAYVENNLTKVQVNDGPTTRYAYDENGALVRIERPMSATVELAYDSRGRVTIHRWADGSEEFYEYDDANNTIRHISPTGGITTYVWNKDGRREEITDPLGKKSVTEYNDAGQPISITSPTGDISRLTYDSLGRTISTHHPLGEVTRYEYLDQTDLPKNITYSDGSKRIFEYDKNHNLTTIKEGKENVIAYTYYQDGLIASVKGIGLPERRFFYHSNGYLKSETNVLGETTQFEWNKYGYLIRQINPDGGTTKWRYDSQNRVVSWTDPAGATIKYSYDKQGHLIKETGPNGGDTRYEYDARGRQIAETDPLGRTKRYKYGADDQPLSFTDPSGQTYRYEYDPSGNLVRAVNPLGGVFNYEYDAMDRLAAKTDWSGRVWRYQYSKDGLSFGITDPTGERTQVKYDADGKIITEVFPDGISVNYFYDNQGRLISTSPIGSGIRTSYEYDSLGRLSNKKYSTGLQVSYQYDAMDNIISRQDNLGTKFTMEYNQSGLLTKHIDPKGEVTRYHYNLARQLIEEINPLGQVKRFSYNNAGDLTEIEGPLGNKAKFEYDDSGRLGIIHHPGGGVSKFSYGALGNIVATTGPLGIKKRYSYNQAGQLIKMVDGNGRITTYIYNSAGRLVQKSLSDGKIVRYKYDVAGYLVEVDDGDFPLRYSYDQAGRISRLEYPAIERTLHYEYDSDDRLMKFIDSESREISYEYDQHGRLSFITASGGGKIAFIYDAKNRLTSITYPNGVKEIQEYDVLDRTVKTTYIDKAGKIVKGWTYNYDAAGNPIKIVDSSGMETSYQYDKSGQLTEEAGPSAKVSYSYLPGGNRGLLMNNSRVIKYEYNKADQLLKAGNERFRYDKGGNLIERRGPNGTTYYFYDTRNLLVKVVSPDGSEVSFGYAPTGARIWRKDKSGTTWFVTDGLNLLTELSEDLTPKATYLHGPGIDQPLMLWRDGQAFHYHTNALGSIAALTDANGKISASYLTDAFGDVKEKKGMSLNPFIFTGRYYESALDLYYYRVRYYVPSLGRFLTKDPVDSFLLLPLWLNRYTYALNAPTRHSDPLGLETFEDIIRAWQRQKKHISPTAYNHGLPPPPQGQRPYHIGLDYGLSPKRPLVLPTHDQPTREISLPGRVRRPLVSPSANDPTRRIRVRRPLVSPSANDPTRRIRVRRPLVSPSANDPTRRIRVRRSLVSPSANDPTRRIRVRRSLVSPSANDPTRRIRVRRPLVSPSANDPTRRIRVRRPLVSPSANDPTRRIRVRRSLVSPSANDPTRRIRVRRSLVSPSANDPTRRIRIRRPLVSPSANDPTRRIRVRRPLVSPSANDPTRRIRVRRPLVSPSANDPTRRIRVRRPLVSPSADQPTQKISVDPKGSASTTGGPPSFAERFGGPIITVALTTEMIIDCINAGKSAGECAEQMLTVAAKGAGITGFVLAVPAAAPVLLYVGGALMTWKGFNDLVEYRYEAQSAWEAKWNAERIEKERAEWTEENLRERLEDDLQRLKERIDNTLSPIAVEFTERCATLEALSDTTRYGQEAEKLEAELPTSDRLKSLASSAGGLERAPEIQAEIETIRDNVERWTENVRTGLGWAGTNAQSCSSKETAEAIRGKYNDAAVVLKAIQKRAARARSLDQELTQIAAEVNQVKGICDETQRIKDRIGSLRSKMASYETLKRAIDEVQSPKNALMTTGGELIGQINGLMMAYPDNIRADMEYRFFELKKLVMSYQYRTKCDPQSYLSKYNVGAGKVINAILSVENRLRGLDINLISDLSRFDRGKVRNALKTIDEAEREAISIVATNADLPEKATECLARLSLVSKGDAKKEGGGFSIASEGEARPVDADDQQVVQVEEEGGGFSIASEGEARPVDADGQQVVQVEEEGGGFSIAGEGEARPVDADDQQVIQVKEEEDGFSIAGKGETRTEDRPLSIRPARIQRSGPSAYHIFATASRLGWAGGLSQYSVGPADQKIIEHLTTAGEHAKAAYESSFEPTRAWPNWRSIRSQFSSWAGQLARTRSDSYRRQLAKTLAGRYGSLADQLSYQTVRDKRRAANCDAYYHRLGYLLAYGQQALWIAEEAGSYGNTSLRNKARRDGLAHLSQAINVLNNMERVKLASGFCVDLRDVKQWLLSIIRGGSLGNQVRTATKAWKTALERIMNQQPPPRIAQKPPPSPPPSPSLPPTKRGETKPLAKAPEEDSGDIVGDWAGSGGNIHRCSKIGKKYVCVLHHVTKWYMENSGHKKGDIVYQARHIGSNLYEGNYTFKILTSDVWKTDPKTGRYYSPKTMEYRNYPHKKVVVLGRHMIGLVSGGEIRLPWKGPGKLNVRKGCNSPFKARGVKSRTKTNGCYNAADMEIWRIGCRKNQNRKRMCIVERNYPEISAKELFKKSGYEPVYGPASLNDCYQYVCGRYRSNGKRVKTKEKNNLNLLGQ